MWKDKTTTDGVCKKIVKKANTQGCNPTRYPMEPKIELSKDATGKAINPTMYKNLVGG